jgi:hypothetical protein
MGSVKRGDVSQSIKNLWYAKEVSYEALLYYNGY